MLDMTREFAGFTRTTESGASVLANPGAMVLLMEMAFEHNDPWLQMAALQQIVRLYGTLPDECCSCVGLDKLVPNIRTVSKEMQSLLLGLVHSIWVECSLVQNALQQAVATFESLLVLIETSPQDFTSELVLNAITRIALECTVDEPVVAMAKVNVVARLVRSMKCLDSVTATIKCLEALVSRHPPCSGQFQTSNVLLRLGQLLSTPVVPQEVAESVLSLLQSVCSSLDFGVGFETSSRYLGLVIHFLLASVLRRLRTGCLHTDSCAHMLLSMVWRLLAGSRQHSFWAGDNLQSLIALLRFVCRDGVGQDLQRAAFDLVGVLLQKSPSSPLLSPDSNAFSTVRACLEEGAVLGDECNQARQQLFVQVLMTPALTANAAHAVLFITRLIGYFTPEVQAELLAKLLYWAGGGLRNLQILTSVPLFGALFEWSQQLAEPNEQLSALLQVLGTHRLSQPELQALLTASLDRHGQPLTLLNTLAHHADHAPASILLDGAHTCLKVSNVLESAWPPPEGFTLVFWCRLPAQASPGEC